MNIKNGLYHQATGLPWAEVSLRFEVATPALCYSQHARQAAISDRYGLPKSLPKTIHTDTLEIFEIEVLNGKVEKFAARISNAVELASGQLVDLVLVCSAPAEGDCGLYVRTLWFNVPGDKHATLNKSNYVPYAK